MRDKIKYPTISVVIATYNSERTIERCLHSIRNQQYPQNKIEIIVADGGSSDYTKAIAKKYGANVIDIDPRIQNAEYNKAIGISKATGEILFLLDHDNILPHKEWLRKAITPFLEHSEVVGVETLRYHYDPEATLLDRYFALFGASDPLAWYLGKADRLSFMYGTYNLMGKAKDYGEYYLVHFTVGNIPTLGANGFLIRRKLLLRQAETEPGKFFHIDVNVDLIRKGFSTYAFIKDSVLHLSAYGNVWYFLKRRMLFMRQYYLNSENLSVLKIRRYSVYEKKDFWRLVYFIVISLTLIIPLLDSLRGYRKIHDLAWFLHPFLCFSLVLVYGYVIVSHQFALYGKKFLAK